MYKVTGDYSISKNKLTSKELASATALKLLSYLNWTLLANLLSRTDGTKKFRQHELSILQKNQCVQTKAISSLSREAKTKDSLHNQDCYLRCHQRRSTSPNLQNRLVG